MGLLTYDEALGIMREHLKGHGRVCEVPTSDCVGRVLAKEIFAVDAYPRFDNSAVDGYAIGTREDADAGRRLRIRNTTFAGDVEAPTIEPGECIRVMTGAPTPSNTFGIAMQEDVKRIGDFAVLEEAVAEGSHLRLRGSDGGVGDVLLPIGHRINAGSRGLLAAQGIRKVSVSESVSVAIVTTGDEIVDEHSVPGAAQVRDANGPMLETLGHSAGVVQVTKIHWPDEFESFCTELFGLAQVVDLILLSGGASVGDRDFVPRAIRELGHIHFHGVSMRPGKPILFGSIGSCLIFGLPGNPASGFVGFEVFVREAIRSLEGASECAPMWDEVRYVGTHLAMGREDFQRVEWRGGGVTAVSEQASFGLRSLALARGLARLPADRDVFDGDAVSVLRLPGRDR
ncbi:MAG: hypothetical protein BGO01_08505 [Armatimonadetes bacterium 55-13]|nr:molybdopterin molybdotransferase MoeA [Armatimonadota bacterium]OJU62507.1 MAG: hypothetical protein BGO01_08505 [Armatimonadetes bacterium 55-13]